MRLRIEKLVDYLQQSLWFIPALGILAAVTLELALAEIDRQFLRDSSAWFVFGGGPESARSFLSTIAASLLSMTVLVFSVTMLVLQLASSQLSPRVMRMFLGDRGNQVVLALFISTFTFALFALRDVRVDFVPGLTVWVGFFGVVASVGAFIYFINHMAHAIRAATVVEHIGDDTRRALDRVYPESLEEARDRETGLREAFEPPGRPDRMVHHRGHAGVITDIDEERLIALADEHDALIAVVPKMGEFVARGSVVAMVWGDIGDAEAELRQSVLTASERSFRQDPAFGFRQLVDIAELALSPGKNDPTTAVQVLDQLHDLLLRLAGRAFPGPVRTGESGRPCLHVPVRTWDDFVSLAFDEIRQYGAGSIQVVRRMSRLFDDLWRDVPVERRPALERQRELLRHALSERLSGPELSAIRSELAHETKAALGDLTRADAAGAAAAERT